MIDVERRYTGPYLGEIDQKTFDFLKGLTLSGLLGKLWERFETTRVRRQTASLDRLANAIEPELNRFIESPYLTLEQYIEPYGEQFVGAWTALKWAANSLICEHYLRSSGVLGLSSLITRQDLEVALQQLPPKTARRLALDTSTSPPSIEGGNRHRLPLSLPDCVIATETQPRRATINYGMYEILATPLNADRLVNPLKNPLREPSGREALQLAIIQKHFKGIGYPEHISLPNPDELKPTLVTALSSQHPYLLKEQFSRVLSADLGRNSIGPISLFFLRLTTRKIAYQPNWEDYFTAV